MGIRKIEQKLEEERRKKKLGAKLAIEHLEAMMADIREVHTRLAQLEKKYGQDMKSNPEAAKKLMALREELGLPEIAGFYRTKMAPGLGEKLTGQGSFYEQLAIQILEIGREESAVTGGLMSLASIVLTLKKKYEGIVVTITDVTKAIDILRKNKLVPKVRELKSGMVVVEFVDLDLAEEHEAVLEVAARYQGVVTREALLMETQWSMAKLDRVLTILKEKQVAEEHTEASGIKFVFRGV